MRLGISPIGAYDRPSAAIRSLLVHIVMCPVTLVVLADHVHIPSSGFSLELLRDAVWRCNTTPFGYIDSIAVA